MRTLDAARLKTSSANGAVQFGNSTVQGYINITANTGIVNSGLMFTYTSYANAAYAHRFAKQDNGTNVPLYLQQRVSLTNTTSWDNVARFGYHSTDANNIALYGNTAVVNGSLIVANVANVSFVSNASFGLTVFRDSLGGNQYITVQEHAGGHVIMGAAANNNAKSIILNSTVTGGNTAAEYGVLLQVESSERVYANVTHVKLNANTYVTGNLGINNATPTYLLTVDSNYNTTNPQILVRNTNTGTSAIASISLRSDTALGQLDIGVASNTYSGYGLIAANGAYVLSKSVNGLGIFADNTSATLRFGAGGTAEAFRVAANGNIGIGNTTPAHKLAVGGSVALTGNVTLQTNTSAILIATNTNYTGSKLQIFWESIANTSYQPALSLIHQQNVGTDHAWTWRTGATAPLMLSYSAAPSWTSFTDLIAVSNIGNVGIGNTAPAQKLVVNGTANVSGTHYALGQFVSTDAWDAALGGGGIYLAADTGNRIEWIANGVAPPAVTTRSAGTKLVLYPGVAAAAVDYGIGVESSAVWYSVSSTAGSHKFYANTTVVMTSNTGGITLGSGGIYPASNTGANILGSATQRWVITANSGSFSGDVTSSGNVVSTGAFGVFNSTNWPAAPTAHINGALAIGAPGPANTVSIGTSNTVGTGWVERIRFATRADSGLGTTTFYDNATFGKDVTVSGNLTISGTTTYINTTNLNIGDNIISLNADLGAVAPSENAGLSVNRGTSANVAILWDESIDRWVATNDGTTYANIAIGAVGTTLVANTTDSSTFYLPMSNTSSGGWSNGVVTPSLSFIPSSGTLTVGNTSVSVAANSSAILINGGAGASGQVLTSNGTATSWSYVVPRVASSGTFNGTITPSVAEVYNIYSISGDITIAAPSGTPTDGQRLTLRIRDNGVAPRSIAWDVAYRPIGVSLPDTTTLSKLIIVGCIYNSTDSLWDVVATGAEA